METKARFLHRQLDLHGHIQANGTVNRDRRIINNRRGVRIPVCVPFPRPGPRHRIAEHAAHQDQFLQQGGDFRVGGKQQPHIGHRANRQQADLPRIRTNGIDHKLDMPVKGELRLMVVRSQHRSLRGACLDRLAQHRRRAARINGDIALSGRPAQAAGQHRPGDRLARHGGDPHQLACRLLQQIGQTDRIVNIRANVGIQQDFLGFHKAVSSFPGRRRLEGCRPIQQYFQGKPLFDRSMRRGGYSPVRPVRSIP